MKITAQEKALILKRRKKSLGNFQITAKEKALILKRRMVNADWLDDLPTSKQKAYIKEHPHSKHAQKHGK